MTTRDATREAMQHGEEALAEGVARLRETASEAEGWLRERAAREPLVALGMALAAGFALGRLLSRRS